MGRDALRRQGWIARAGRGNRLRDRLVRAVGEHLVLLLHAPLGAMGGVAVGERRSGFDRPGKSAILGLLAPRLRLDRSHQPAPPAPPPPLSPRLPPIPSRPL